MSSVVSSCSISELNWTHGKDRLKLKAKVADHITPLPAQMHTKKYNFAHHTLLLKLVCQSRSVAASAYFYRVLLATQKPPSAARERARHVRLSVCLALVSGNKWTDNGCMTRRRAGKKSDKVTASGRQCQCKTHWVKIWYLLKIRPSWCVNWIRRANTHFSCKYDTKCRDPVGPVFGARMGWNHDTHW